MAALFKQPSSQPSLANGDTCLLHGLKAVHFNGEYGVIVGPESDGRFPVRITSTISISGTCSKIRSGNLLRVAQHSSTLAASNGSSGSNDDLRSALETYRRAAPWTALYMNHVVQFKVGRLSGYALSMGSTDPSRKCPPALCVSASFHELDRLKAPPQPPLPAVIKCVFDGYGSSPDSVVSMGSMGALETKFSEGPSEVASLLGESGVALLAGGARALAAFMASKVANPSGPPPSVFNSTPMNFLPIMGTDHSAKTPLVYGYLWHGSEGAGECDGCGEMKNLDFACRKCRVEHFCSARCCQRAHLSSNCSKLEKMARHKDGKPGFGALTLTEETTSSCVSLCGFLRGHGLHGLNWWARSCMCEIADGEPSSKLSAKLPDLSKLDTLEKGLAPLPESQVPSEFNQEFGAPELFVRNWTSWCVYRGVDFTSPAPLVLHNALTVFHAIRLAAPHCFSPPSKQHTVVTVHIVGVEREVFELGTFSEVAALLPPAVGLQLVLIGPGVPKSRDGEVMNFTRTAAGAREAQGRLFFCEEYSKFAARDPRYTRPDVFVGLNAGLAAPNPDYFAGILQPWSPTILSILEAKVPAIFTDYYRYSAELPLQLYKMQIEEQGGSAIAPSLNPFRQPLAKEKNERYHFGKSQLLPSFNNGIIFGWTF